MKKKLKTNSGAKKRFKVSGTGKLVSKKVGRRHNLSHKARSRMRRLEGGLVIDTNRTVHGKIKAQLPYA